MPSTPSHVALGNALISVFSLRKVQANNVSPRLPFVVPDLSLKTKKKCIGQCQQTVSQSVIFGCAAEVARRQRGLPLSQEPRHQGAECPAPSMPTAAVVGHMWTCVVACRAHLGSLRLKTHTRTRVKKPLALLGRGRGQK